MTVSQFVALVEMIAESITERNDEIFDHFLAKVDIPKEINLKDFIMFFYHLLSTCYESKNSYPVRKLVEFWESKNLDSKFPVMTSLYVFQETDPIVLRYVEGFLEDRNSAFDHMLKLIQYDSGPEMFEAIAKINEVFGFQPRQVYKDVMDEIDRIEEELNTGIAINAQLFEALSEVIFSVSDYAPIPSHIVTREEWQEEDFIPTHEELMETLNDFMITEEAGQKQIKDDEARIASLLFGSANLAKELEIEGEIDRIDKVYEKIRKMDDEKKDEIVEEIHDSLESFFTEADSEFFRILGPCLQEMKQPLNSKSDNICNRYGGHRMLFCHDAGLDGTGHGLVYDYLDHQKHLIDEWFTGSCDICRLKIREKHHALRLPLRNFWVGCFCSFQCVRKDTRASNKFVSKLITQIEKDFKEYGIYDRTWEEPERVLPPELDLFKMAADIEEMTKEFAKENPPMTAMNSNFHS